MSRILCLHSSADLYGSDRSLLRLVRGLGDHELTVLLPEDGPLVRELSDAGAVVRLASPCVLRRRYCTPAGLVRLAWRWVVSTACLAREIRRLRSDVVYSNTTVLLGVGLAARLAGVPHVQHVRETVARPRAVRWLLSLNAVCSTRVVCVSEATRRNYVAGFPFLRRRCVVVHNGIDLDCARGAGGGKVRSELGLEAGDVMVGTVGRISAVKGFDVFVRAAERLLDGQTGGPRLFFVIVGDAYRGQEWRDQALRERIAGSRFASRIRALPFRDDIPDVMAALDIYAHTSVLPDSFPTTVLEAMAAGLPIVATRLGGVVEMIEDGCTGMLVAVGDEAELAGAWGRLAGDAPLRRRLGAGAAAVVRERFSATRYVASMARELSSLTPNRPGAGRRDPGEAGC